MLQILDQGSQKSVCSLRKVSVACPFFNTIIHLWTIMKCMYLLIILFIYVCVCACVRAYVHSGSQDVWDDYDSFIKRNAGTAFFCCYLSSHLRQCVFTCCFDWWELHCLFSNYCYNTLAASCVSFAVSFVYEPIAYQRVWTTGSVGVASSLPGPLCVGYTVKDRRERWASG